MSVIWNFDTRGEDFAEYDLRKYIASVFFTEGGENSGHFMRGCTLA